MKTKYINYCIIILLLWLPISGIINNLTDDRFAQVLYRLYRLLVLIIAFSVFIKQNAHTYIRKNYILIIIYLIYLAFIFYETNYNRPSEVKGFKYIGYGIYTSNQLAYNFIFYLTISCYFRKHINEFDEIIKYYLPFSCVGFVALMAIILSKHGLSFLLVEALKFNGVTLIVFSYDIVFALLAVIYAWHRKIISKWMVLSIGIVDLILILSMGKRGPLLCIAVVLFCIWLFKRFSMKKCVSILTVCAIGYSLFTIYIDDVISIMTMVNPRLGDTFSAFYYYGDLNGRESLSEYAIEQIKMSPLWGKFPGLITPPALSFFFGLHPHNIWLEAIMTMGYIGSIPFFLLVFYICIKKLIPALGSNSFYMFFAILFISEIVHGFMSGALIESYIWMAMCILFSYNSSIIPNGKISRKQ